MNWLLYHIAFTFLVLWPVNHFINPGLDKPLVFIGVFMGIFIAGWFLAFFVNRRYFYKVPRLVKFILYFLKETVSANLNVARDILTPGLTTRPAIIAIPLEVTSDFEIVTLASVITLTPGTLSIDVSADRKTLYVHEMYVKNGKPEDTRSNIKQGFEKRILQLFR